MTRLFTALIFGFLLLNVNQIFAKDVASQVNNDTQYGATDEYNFNDNSFYLSDEQLQDAQEIDKIDDSKANFESKIINSSHFSSGTATKTYIPINKVK